MSSVWVASRSSSIRSQVLHVSQYNFPFLGLFPGLILVKVTAQLLLKRNPQIQCLKIAVLFPFDITGQRQGCWDGSAVFTCSSHLWLQGGCFIFTVSQPGDRVKEKMGLFLFSFFGGAGWLYPTACGTLIT